MNGDDKSLAGEAYLTLKQRILRGELVIGQALSRRRISLEMGMSLLPISDALRRLELEGLLETKPRAGTRVRIPTPEGVRGHYLVREALEVQAARLFIDNALAEEKSELVRMAARVDTLGNSETADRILYFSLHEELHNRIAECTRCAPLNEAIEKTHALALTWLCVARPQTENSPPRRSHQELMEALSKGDKLIAAEAMSKHITSGMERTLIRLKPYFDLGQESGHYIRASKLQNSSSAK